MKQNLKFLSALLVLTMIFSLLSVPASALETETGIDNTEEVQIGEETDNNSGETQNDGNENGDSGEDDIVIGNEDDIVSDDYTDENLYLIELSENTSDAYNNFDILMSGIGNAAVDREITVKIKEPGEYRIASRWGGGIKMRSNVTLDLNGSTLIRYGSEMANLLQNVDFCGNHETGGYDLTYNFKVMNGTLDGAGGSADEVNLVNLGHARDFTIENVNLRNCRNCHLIELSGCKNVTIKGCTFSGFKGDGYDGSYTNREALQLDINREGWNGTYTPFDNSVCKNITVENCEFIDYPTGIGNHHTVYGTKNHSTDIKIINNRFTNTKSELGYAICAFAFENSVIKDNVITGKYVMGIRICGGSVDVSNNTVSNVSYNPIYIINSFNSVKDGIKEPFEESAHSCEIKNNIFTTTGADCYAVSVFNGCKVKLLQGNTISSSKKYGVICSGKGSEIEKITENSINGKTRGVCIFSGAAVKSITANAKIYSSDGEGIFIWDNAKATNITSNNITSASKNGLSVGQKSSVDTISKNTISGKTRGIFVYGNSSVKNITNNTKISSTDGEGVYVWDNAKTTNISSNNIVSSTKNGLTVGDKSQVDTISKNSINGKTRGIFIYSNSVVKNITGNTKINASNGEGILAWNSAKVTNITSNTITSPKQYGLSVSEKTQIEKISKNSISGKIKGICVASNSVVKYITGNTNITSPAGDGIWMTDASITNITSNTVKDCGINGILITATGKVSKIQSNTIKNNKSLGIWFNNPNTTVSMGQNKYSANKSGNERILATVYRIYTVKYQLNGGTNSTDNPNYFTKRTATVTLKNPTKRGYSFKGWYSDAKFKKKVTKITKGSSGNKTFYAKWAKKTYTITYTLNGGTQNKKNPKSYTVTTADIVLQKPTRNGCTFVGWYSDKNYKTKVTKIAKGSAGNKTLYAKWQKN